MSSDNKPDRRRPVDVDEELVEQPRQIVADATEATSEKAPTVARRRKSMNKSDSKANRFKKYIPAGYGGRLVNCKGDRPEELYLEDWEYAVTEDGHTRVFVEGTNTRPGAPSNRQVLMIKKLELIKADGEAQVAMRKKALARGAKTVSGLEGKYFQNTGISVEQDID